ncbi:MAG: hypothetical protein LBP76_12740 [Treponema sp.]|nr:hypothetical protein [Treponema sp.]
MIEETEKEGVELIAKVEEVDSQPLEEGLTIPEEIKRRRKLIYREWLRRTAARPSFSPCRCQAVYPFLPLHPPLCVPARGLLPSLSFAVCVICFVQRLQKLYTLVDYRK